MVDADPTSVVYALAERGFNVDPEAAALLAAADDPTAAIEATVARVSPNALKITASEVATETPVSPATQNPTVSSGNTMRATGRVGPSPPETGGVAVREVTITGDVTGQSTGTGEYDDFIAVFRDRYERLADTLRGRVKHRTARSLVAARGGTEVGMIGLVDDIRTTRNGHRLIELEDSTGGFPALALSDRDLDDTIESLLHDEVIGVEGTLSDDGGIIFIDTVYLPDVPRTHTPRTADRHVQAVLISDTHVGSKEFLDEAWSSFTDWLHTPEAKAVEYLLLAGDMVEGVGVYPGQDADLDIIDIYAQYEAFSEALKAVPGDIEIIIIPGNHDAVRLAEPQPALEDDLASALDAHDIHWGGNPVTVEIESVRILMYHGASLDAIIAGIPDPTVSYEHPHEAMTRLLQKRHVAPPYGGGVRIAPEERDYLVIDEIPDVFHTGHVHTVGVGEYRGVRLINSGCWQAQTDYQRRNNLTPHPGQAPILDLDTLEVTIRKFV